MMCKRYQMFWFFSNPCIVFFRYVDLTSFLAFFETVPSLGKFETFSLAHQYRFKFLNKVLNSIQSCSYSSTLCKVDHLSDTLISFISTRKRFVTFGQQVCCFWSLPAFGSSDAQKQATPSLPLKSIICLGPSPFWHRVGAHVQVRCRMRVELGLELAFLNILKRVKYIQFGIEIGCGLGFELEFGIRMGLELEES